MSDACSIERPDELRYDTKGAFTPRPHANAGWAKRCELGARLTPTAVGTKQSTRYARTEITSSTSSFLKRDWHSRKTGLKNFHCPTAVGVGPARLARGYALPGS